jgi:kumamolisin
MSRLGGHMLASLKGAKPVAASPGSDAQPLTLTVVLNRSDQAGFDRYLQDVYDPHSPNYRRFLKLPEMTERFGPSRNAYDSVLGYLRRNGFTLAEGSANRMTLTVRGTRAGAERAFHVHIRDFESGGRRFFANDSEPAVPRSLALNIRAVGGLENAATPRPAANAFIEWASLQVSNAVSFFASLSLSFKILALVLAGAVGTVGYQISQDQGPPPPPPAPPKETPGWTEGAGMPHPGMYHADLPILGAVPPAAATGAGQKIGVLAFSSFQMSDVQDWLALAQLPASQINNLSQVHVNGGAHVGPGETDVLLGTDIMLTNAPGAQIVVYDAPFTGTGTSFQTVLNAMINDHVTIISNSFYYCEDETTAADAQSIDAILATAAGLGISVFNATGDSGATCSGGNSNDIAVPADSPNATAVGGTSLTVGPADTYGGETWWDGSAAVPPSGQGGFGLSQYFNRPAYQAGLIANPMRSVPDVVIMADPRLSYPVCQQDAGGCPTGQIQGGTSMSVPIWAAFTAQLNQSQGHNIGLLNPLAYPLAGTGAFHSATSMGTDAAHVGLGSLNLNLLNLGLAGLVPGPVDASGSVMGAGAAALPFGPYFGTVAADGATAAAIVVRLRDASGNMVSGKTVQLSTNAGSHAVIASPTGVSSVANGAALFNVTDATPEYVTFSATDTTDGVALTHTIAVTFVGPPASAGGINAVPPTPIPSDGTSTATITVTLQDGHGNGVPAKLVTLSQAAATRSSPVRPRP